MTVKNKRKYSGINLTSYCIVRPEIPYAALVSLRHTGPQRLDHKFFSCGIRPQPSGKGSSLYPRSQSHPFIQTSSSLYSNKPITFSCGNQGAPHPLVTAKSASLSSQVQPLCGPAWRVVPSPPGL